MGKHPSSTYYGPPKLAVNIGRVGDKQSISKTLGGLRTNQLLTRRDIVALWHLRLDILIHYGEYDKDWGAGVLFAYLFGWLVWVLPGRETVPSHREPHSPGKLVSDVLTGENPMSAICHTCLGILPQQ